MNEYMGKWRPKHIINGGWPDAQSTAWSQKLDIYSKCLPPHAPRKRGAVCQIDAGDGYLSMIHCKIGKDIAKRKQNDGPPTRRAFERSLEVGRLKR